MTALEPSTGERLEADEATVELYGRYCRPGVVELLRAAALDAVYEQARGSYLWRRRGGELVPVLDLAGGFGAGLFGHNHPELVAEAKRLLDSAVPFQAQGSCRRGAALLAQELSRRLAGDYVAIFTNSGAETVEAALKHARLETGRPLVWAVRGGFHGKTGCAVQMSWSYRQPFESWGPEVRFLDPYDPADWQRAEPQRGLVAAVFVEPVLGEGGIRPLPADFVAWLSSVCGQSGAPLIADEIQSGCGRTGTFLASEQIGLEPDYVLLAKALGGGLTKIGALLVRRSRFVPEFASIHTSTFAEDDYSCLLGLRALRLLDDDGLPARCAAAGDHLLAALEELRARYPGQVREVRGRGLMIGVELARQDDSPSSVLRILSQHHRLGWIAAAYLLNVHDVRVLPTLGDPWTLRIEPNAYVSTADLDRFVVALGGLCEALEKGDAAHLTSGGSELPALAVRDYRASSSRVHAQAPRTTRRVAFLGHLIGAEHLPLFDPSLGALPAASAHGYLERMSHFGGPSVLDRVHVGSLTGDEVHLTFIGLNLSSQQILERRRTRGLPWIREQVETAVRLARDQGCGVVGLGGYTSSVTANGLLVRNPGIALTTGNSLTVGVAVEALLRAAEDAGIEPASAHLAVVGVPGNIASTCALLLAPRVGALTLISRRPESARAQELVARVREIAPSTAVELSGSLDDLRPCTLIVAATVSGGGLIQPQHLGPQRLVLCDISVPSDVAPGIARERPAAQVIAGGVLRLPRDHDFQIAGLPLDRGQVLACMAETLIMGLEGESANGSIGEVTIDGVERALALATKHGFTLDRLKLEHSY